MIIKKRDGLPCSVKELKRHAIQIRGVYFVVFEIPHLVSEVVHAVVTCPPFDRERSEQVSKYVPHQTRVNKVGVDHDVLRLKGAHVGVMTEIKLLPLVE